jgi:hypothetical protein
MLLTGPGGRQTNTLQVPGQLVHIVRPCNTNPY